MWTCSKCSEAHEDQFDECWNCAPKKLAPPPPSSRMPSFIRIGFRLVYPVFGALLGNCIWSLIGDSVAEIAYGTWVGGVLGYLVMVMTSIWSLLPSAEKDES